MPDTTIYFYDGQGWKGISISADSLRIQMVIDSLRKNDSITFLQQFSPKSTETESEESFHLLVFAGLFLLVIIAFNFGKLFFRFRIPWLALPSNEDSHQINEFHSTNAAPEHILEGNRQKYSEEELHEKLSKHFSYYNKLTGEEKQRFVYRLKQFMLQKTFIVYSDTIYHEMLILTSASAIQLTFGLKNYLLPSYDTIKIFPEEFVGLNPLRILAGNVSGSVISIAWNHLLEGAKNPKDGKNLGLHEMSHALSMEMMVHQKRKFKKWEWSMDAVRDHFSLVSDKKSSDTDLYNENAKRNEEEFFAESIELFFEKPGELNSSFPGVYQQLCSILNQDPKENKLLIPLEK